MSVAMARMTSFDAQSLTLSLPTEVLTKWSSLCMGGSLEVSSMRAGQSDVIVNLSRSKNSAHVKVTGSGTSFVECLSGSYFCELTNAQPPRITTSVTETAQRHLLQPPSITTSVTETAQRHLSQPPSGMLIPSGSISERTLISKKEVLHGSGSQPPADVSPSTNLEPGEHVPETFDPAGVLHEHDVESVRPKIEVSASSLDPGVKGVPVAPMTDIRGQVPETEPRKLAQRKSTRLKREVWDDDFVVPVKKRNIPPAPLPDNEDSKIGTELKPKRARGRPRKCPSSSEDKIDDYQTMTSSSVPLVSVKLEGEPLEGDDKKDTSIDATKMNTTTRHRKKATRKYRENNKESDTGEDRVWSSSTKAKATLQCTLCGADHNNKSQLKRHVKATHSLQWCQYEQQAQTDVTDNISSVQASVQCYEVSDVMLNAWCSLQCLLCGKSWDSLTKFKNHLYTNHKVSHSEHVRVLGCTDLASRRVALDALRAASDRQMRLSGRHCPVCLCVQLSRAQLLRHITTHKDRADYQQYVEEFSREAEESKSLRSLSQRNCRKSNTSKLQHQMEEDAIDDNCSITCCVCSRSYDSGLALRRHINSCHAMSWVEYMVLLNLPAAEQATKLESITLSKNQHKQKCLDAEGQVIQCLRCLEMVPCKDYRDHLKKDHPDVENVAGTISRMETVINNTSYQAINGFSVTCTICQDTINVNSVQKHFKTRHKTHPDREIMLANLQSEIRQKANHNRSIARGERSALGIKYSCQHCGTHFQDKSSRSAHMNYQCIKNESRKQSYTCKYCGQKGTSEKWYEDHIKRHDPVGNNYVCSMCGRGYLNRSGLQTHVARVHNKVVKFACEFCDRKFYVKSHYENHVLKHSNVRKYSCDVCKKWFKNPICVRRHMRLHEKSDHRPRSSSKILDPSPSCEPALPPEGDDSLSTCTSVKNDKRTTDSVSTSLSNLQVLSMNNPTQTAQLVLLPSIPENYTCTSTSSQEHNTQWSSKLTANDPNWTDTEPNKTVMDSHQVPLMVAVESVAPRTSPRNSRTSPGNSRTSPRNSKLVSLLANNSNFQGNTSEKPEKSLQAPSPTETAVNINPSLTEIPQSAMLQVDTQPGPHQHGCASLEGLLSASANIIVSDSTLLTQGQEVLQPDAADEISMIQEVYIDDEGNILGTLPNVEGSAERGVMVGSEDGNMPNFVIMKAESGDSKMDGSVLDLSSLIWITAPETG